MNTKKKLSIIGLVIGIIAVLFGIMVKFKKAASISIIGGADGPTAIFIAGKVGDNFSWGLVLIGAVIAAIAVLAILKNRQK